MSNKRKFLSDGEIELAAEKVEGLLGNHVASLLKHYSIDPAEHLRFHAVAARCTEERESRGWSLKDAAKRLGTAQYKLRAIESGSLRELQPQLLASYLCELELEPWFAEWASENTDLANKLLPSEAGRLTRR